MYPRELYPAKIPTPQQGLKGSHSRPCLLNLFQLEVLVKDIGTMIVPFSHYEAEEVLFSLDDDVAPEQTTFCSSSKDVETPR